MTFDKVKERVHGARLADPDFLSQVSVLMPCDVTSPLLGPAGAAYVFGPQKGAKTQEQIECLDRNIEHVVRMYLTGRLGNDDLLERVATTPGAGASGGLVGAFIALFGHDKVKIVSGMDFVAELSNLEQKIVESDLVITGEGSFDVQTLQGKAVSQIIDISMRHDKEGAVFCGINKVPEEAMQEKYTSSELERIQVFDLVSSYGQDAAMGRTQDCLERIFMENEEVKAMFVDGSQ